MYSVFLSIAPVSPWAKNGVSSFLMTSPLMNIWCHVLAHIWKEANSQYKYLMSTLYILTSHISINYKTNMWTHNKTALLATAETIFPHYLSSCYWKAATEALGRLHFLLINLWGRPPLVIPADHGKALVSVSQEQTTLYLPSSWLHIHTLFLNTVKKHIVIIFLFK